MLLPPEQSRDEAMYDLLNHEETMLPNLSNLCPISWPDVQVVLDLEYNAVKNSFCQMFPCQVRRSDHRRGFFNGRNLCLDIVTGDGLLIGTTGFREVKSKVKES